jgi:ABC-2 type transport system ATP-binding protein
VRLRGGAEELAAVVRALDAEDVAMKDFQLHAPTLDDVFLSKTGRKLETGDEEGTGEHPEVVPA